MEQKIKCNKGNSFIFNQFHIKRIESINQLLGNKFKKAYDLAEKMEQEILTIIGQTGSFISDYEIEFRLSLFEEKKYAHVEELQGNPFFEYEPSYWFRKKGGSDNEDINEYKNWLFNENHNEFQHQLNHPLKDQYHCILLHDLYDHTYLSWQDIVDIEEVWFEVMVLFQNIDNSLKLSDMNKEK